MNFQLIPIQVFKLYKKITGSHAYQFAEGVVSTGGEWRQISQLGYLGHCKLFLNGPRWRLETHQNIKYVSRCSACLRPN